MQRRSRLDIVEDMLSSLANAGGRLKPTRLMYKSNLSHTQMKGYLEEMFTKGFLEEVKVKKSKFLEITLTGRQFLGKLQEIRAFEEGFGLE